MTEAHVKPTTTDAGTPVESDEHSLTVGPEAWLAGSASVCFTVDFNPPDGSPTHWPTPDESAAFLAAYDPDGRLDPEQVRAAGDYHLAYIARCVHSVGGHPEVAGLLTERARDRAGP